MSQDEKGIIVENSSTQLVVFSSSFVRCQSSRASKCAAELVIGVIGIVGIMFAQLGHQNNGLPYPSDGLKSKVMVVNDIDQVIDYQNRVSVNLSSKISQKVTSLRKVSPLENKINWMNILL